MPWRRRQKFAMPWLAILGLLGIGLDLCGAASAVAAGGWADSLSVPGLPGFVTQLQSHRGELLVTWKPRSAGRRGNVEIGRWTGSGWSSLTPEELMEQDWPSAGGVLGEYYGWLIWAGMAQQNGLTTSNTIVVHDTTWTSFPALPTYDSWHINELLSWQGQLIAAGRFKNRDAEITENVLAWDGDRWRSLGLQLGWQFFPKLAVWHNRLVVACSIRGSYLDDDYLRQESNRHVISLFDGKEWQTLKDGTGGLVGALTVWKDELIAGFSFADSAESVYGVMKYAGGRWEAMGGVFQGHGHAASIHDLEVYEGSLVVAGSFAGIGSYACQNIAFFDGEIWRPLAEGIGPGMAKWLAVHRGGLWCAGRFKSAGGQPVRNVACWQGPLPLDQPLMPLPTAAAVPVADPKPVRPAANPAPAFHNGDFREWEDGCPKGWSLEPTGVGRYAPPTACQDPAMVLERLPGGGVKLRSPSEDRCQATLHQRFAVQPGRHCRVRAEVRVDGECRGTDRGSCQFYLSLGSLWERQRVTDTTYTWFEQTLPADERSTSGRISFFLSLGSIGELDIRQVTVETVDITPADCFDLLIEELNHHYAHFRLGGAPWDSLIAHYRPVAARAVNRQAFVHIICELLANLEDRRIFVETSSSDVTARYPTYGSGYDRRAWTESGRDRDFIKGRLSGLPLRAHTDSGWLSDGIAYLSLGEFNVREMSRSGELPDLTGVRGLILDLRVYQDRGADAFITGCHAAARRFVSLLSGHEYSYALVGERDTERASGYAELEELHLEAVAAGRQPPPIVCLIGPFCRGIGAELAMMCKALPHATLIGQRTGATTGSPHCLVLPNAVRVYYPRPTFFLPDGQEVTDRQGVPPDIPLPASSEGDSVFTAAVQLLRETLHASDD